MDWKDARCGTLVRLRNENGATGYIYRRGFFGRKALVMSRDWFMWIPLEELEPIVLCDRTPNQV